MRKLLDCMNNPCRLISLPAKRHRREIWRIRLGEDAITRHETEQLIVRPLFERYDSAERHIPACLQRDPCKLMGSGITMKDPDHTSLTCLADHCRRVLFSVTRVHNHRNAGLPCQRKLFREGPPLLEPRRVVVMVIQAA